ncbi:penicillin-binding protein [Methylobacterium sp. E-016]|uniref:penicillin-binding protein n=1 Tax=Methylobacterium sp. E-016 TaxID=2836556 RepID=UPI001FBA53C2|nr:penicillin-binding protein [Methylobacterium sp. E-016]MCJ2075295.1 penicillin-binding protein [Methylobacterium sp. E-016]
MAANLSRRGVLGAFLVVVASRVPVAASDGILPAIRWAETADAAYSASGRVAADLAAAGLPMPAGWAAYRASLARVRQTARLDLYALTPTTPEAAAALAAYHTARGERAGSTGARRAARRRLRKVFALPGAVLPPRPT